MNVVGYSSRTKCGGGRSSSTQAPQVLATTGGNGGSRLRVPLERGRRVQTAMFFILFNYTLSETVNTFKSRLDKFWQHQDMIYDFQAELHGTGSRSLHHN